MAAQRLAAGPALKITAYNGAVMRGTKVARLCATVALAGTLAVSNAAPNQSSETARSYWAFQVPDPVVDPVPSSSWSRTLVDAFILRKLQAEGLEPSPTAAKERLLRRVYLDLTGLPPTPAQAEDFLTDDSPQAYDRLVESLLASPHYGERWAQKWLDVVRYADTDGFERDGYREHGWRYRDYVVRSFNADKPYDRFIREQVAGDELFPGDTDALIATGFHGAGPRHVTSGNQDKEEARQEVLTEMALGIGQSILGLTVQCARCHDHKFDPISQKDYYSLESFFMATEIEDREIASAGDKSSYDRAIEAHEKRVKPIKDQLAEIEAPFNDQVRGRKRAALDPEFRAALELPEDGRTADQERLAKEAASQIKPVWYEILPLMPEDVRARRAALRQRLHALALEEPDPPAAAFAVDNSDEAPQAYVLLGGDYRRRGAPVQPAFPSAVGALGLEAPSGPEGRRSALARWLTHPENPLTARVMVNRIWEFRMGSGLLPDPNNLGALGGTPTHPELLDALASRFAREGWSVKAMDRLIVLSSAYRQSMEIDQRKATSDPGNRWYWRAHRKRLSGEAIRDTVLAAAGRLNQAVGGKPVRIPIEREIYDLIFTEAEPDNLWPVTPDRAQHDRRSLYLLNKRTVRLPFLANFDQPDTMTSCAIRPRSTHALQSLSLLNSDFMQEHSRALAERLRRACGPGDADCQIESAYRFALARRPTPAETRAAAAFLAADAARLEDFSLAILNRNEFVYRP